MRLEYGDGFFSLKRNDGWTVEHVRGGLQMADRAETAMLERIAELERQLAEAQAQMGAMREALEYADRWRHGHVHGSRPGVCGDCKAIDKVTAALAPEAGKELLARLEKAERDLSWERCEDCDAPIALSRYFDADLVIGPRIAGVWYCDGCRGRSVVNVRAHALEEAAKVADRLQRRCEPECADIAAAIRALAQSTSPDVAE